MSSAHQRMPVHTSQTTHSAANAGDQSALEATNSPHPDTGFTSRRVLSAHTGSFYSVNWNTAEGERERIANARWLMAGGGYSCWLASPCLALDAYTCRLALSLNSLSCAVDASSSRQASLLLWTVLSCRRRTGWAAGVCSDEDFVRGRWRLMRLHSMSSVLPW